MNSAGNENNMLEQHEYVTVQVGSKWNKTIAK